MGQNVIHVKRTWTYNNEKSKKKEVKKMVSFGNENQGCTLILAIYCQIS